MGSVGAVQDCLLMQIMNGNMTKNETFFRKANMKLGKIFEITKNMSLKMLTGKKFVSAHIKYQRKPL